MGIPAEYQPEEDLLKKGSNSKEWRKDFTSALSSLLPLRLLQHQFHSTRAIQEGGFQETRLANASTLFLGLPMHTGETQTAYVGQMGLDSALLTVTRTVATSNPQPVHQGASPA